MGKIFVGCAGWSVPSTQAGHFPAGGSHLERYAAVLPAVEINTSFYRPHRPQTYARWRDSVPDDFRFAVKVPRVLTHDCRLQRATEPMARFIGEATHLEHKLGCLLVQLPPSLRFDADLACEFFSELTGRQPAPVVCEARHATWFCAQAQALLAQLDVSPVFADPPAGGSPPLPEQAQTAYIRLHGSPEIYHSSYSDDFLARLVAQISELNRRGSNVWCIFDNTASGAAVPNALSLLERLACVKADRSA